MLTTLGLILSLCALLAGVLIFTDDALRRDRESH